MFCSIIDFIKDGFSGNVAVNYKGEEVEETEPFQFRTENPVEQEPEIFLEKPTGDQIYKKYPYTGEQITFSMSDLGGWYDNEQMEILAGELFGTEIGTYTVIVGFGMFSTAAWGTGLEDWNRDSVTVTFEIFDKSGGGKFILTDEAAASHPYKFQYADFSELQGDISDYVYTVDTALYITRLALNDTIEKLLAQFANGESIKVFDMGGTEITDYTKVLMTGIMLRLVDGENVLNQLTISVLGDVNGDGKINTIDKAQQNSLTLGTKELGAAEKLACDINADGKVNTIDKARLNSQSLGTTDIYEGLRLPALAPAARTVSETCEEVAETEIEPIVEEIAVIAVEEFATDEPETEREVPVESAEIFVLLAEPKQYIKLNF